MSDKFLNIGGTNININNGSTTLFGATIGAINLNPSQPIKTNSVRQLVSSKLDIDDINNLKSELNQTIKNPFQGTFQATDFETSNYFSVNDELQKIDNLTASTANNTNITGTLNASSVLTAAVADSTVSSIISLGSTSANISANDVSITGNFTTSAGATITGILTAGSVRTDTITDTTASSSITLDNTSANIGAVDVNITGNFTANNLSLSSTTEGFVPNKLTQIQEDAISTPIDGNIIYNTDLQRQRNYRDLKWNTVIDGSYSADLSKASVILSLRKVNPAYNGFCCRVRRSIDDAELDIGFDSNGLLDKTAFDNHIGVGSGFARTMYDQTGQGNHYEQTISNDQPQISFNSVNGVLVPVMVFVRLGTNDGDHLQSISGKTTSTFNMNDGIYALTTFFKTTAANDNYFLFGAINKKAIYECQLGDGTANNSTHSNLRIIPNGDVGTQIQDYPLNTEWNNDIYHTITVSQNSNNTKLRYDGLVSSQVGVNAPTDNIGLVWGARETSTPTETLTFSGTMNEYIAWSSEPDPTDISIIEAGQKLLWVEGKSLDYNSGNIVQVNDPLSVPGIISSAADMAFTPNKLTQIQEDALVPVDGNIIYNTGLQRQRNYRNSKWNTVIDGSSPADVSNANVILSLRKVNPLYNGFCCRIRRDDVTNAELDIGFDSNGLLDKSALDTHVAGNTACVSVMYDQTGKGNHYEQQTFIKQPIITYETINGNSIPVMTFSRTGVVGSEGDHFDSVNTAGTMGTTDRIYALSTFFKTNETGVNFLFGSETNGAYELHLGGPSNNIAIIGVGNATVSPDWNNNEYHTLTLTRNNTINTLVYDSTIHILPTNNPNYLDIKLNWGNREVVAGDTLTYQDIMNEYILWDSPPSSTALASIEAGQKDLWVDGNLNYATRLTIPDQLSIKNILVEDRLKVGNIIETKAYINDDLPLPSPVGSIAYSSTINAPCYCTGNAWKRFTDDTTIIALA